MSTSEVQPKLIWEELWEGVAWEQGLDDEWVYKEPGGDRWYSVELKEREDADEYGHSPVVTIRLGSGKYGSDGRSAIEVDVFGKKSSAEAKCRYIVVFDGINHHERVFGYLVRSGSRVCTPWQSVGVYEEVDQRLVQNLSKLPLELDADIYVENLLENIRGGVFELPGWVR